MKPFDYLVIGLVLIALALSYCVALTLCKTSLGWKVPRRQCYTPSFFIWLRWTFRCHVWLRLHRSPTPRGAPKLMAFLFLLLACGSLMAQTNSLDQQMNQAAPVTVGPIALDPFLMATNLTLAVSPAYAPHLRNSDGVLDHWGATVALLYPVSPVSQNLYAGYRFDYLGSRFTASTVSATYQVPLLLWNRVHVQPFATAGANVEMSGGRGGSLGVVAGAGAYVTVHSFGPAGTLSAFYESEVWTIFNNARVDHLGLFYNIQF